MPRVDRWSLLASSVALLAAVSAWLWPIGVGGRMPVGGDVTQFSIGLMAVLAEAFRSGQLPLWNDLWGFGFPGVAESQMGVYYPPHWILYGVLPVEWAYTTSLLGHLGWGALGAAWAARRFGVSAWGSALTGFAWTASGFYLIHLPHHWSATVGSWMPWAWGLGWALLRGEGERQTAWLLAAVLAIQILPGHFQLAFCTQIGLLVLAIGAGWNHRTAPNGSTRRWLGFLGALVVVPLLSAMQLTPTFQLAQLAESQRTPNYLADFAATPIHLVSYVAPGLFHWSPLWRPVAWDPFHTSPEEHLAYLGLVPLFLAIGAIVLGVRRDGATQALALVAVVSLVLSLGPYMPGFSIYSQIPGFSFFRAPARWSLATGLALAILAGKGFDALQSRSWPRPGRALAGFLVVALAFPLGILLAFEIGLRSTEGNGSPMVARAFERVFELLPFEDELSFRDVMRQARTPQRELRVASAMAREGLGPLPPNGLRLDRERFGIYRHELGGTVCLCLGLLLLAPFARRRWFLGAILIVTLLDLWLLGRHRSIDLAPIAPLTEQSTVLGQLAGEPRGTRVVESFGNLSMIAGASPVAAYRTLDLPIQRPLLQHAALPVGSAPFDSAIVDSMQALGAPIRILDPFELAAIPTTWEGWNTPGQVEVVADPELAAWRFGRDWVESQDDRVHRFLLWKPELIEARAWLVPLEDDAALSRFLETPANPDTVLGLFQQATPLSIQVKTPEHLEIELQTDRRALVVITQLNYPEWEASWIGAEPTQGVELLEVLGGWQGVVVPSPGAWTLRLEYRGRIAWLGLAISGAAWAGWLWGFGGSWWRDRRGGIHHGEHRK